MLEEYTCALSLRPLGYMRGAARRISRDEGNRDGYMWLPRSGVILLRRRRRFDSPLESFVTRAGQRRLTIARRRLVSPARAILISTTSARSAG